MSLFVNGAYAMQSPSMREDAASVKVIYQMIGPTLVARFEGKPTPRNILTGLSQIAGGYIEKINQLINEDISPIGNFTYLKFKAIAAAAAVVWNQNKSLFRTNETRSAVNFIDQWIVFHGNKNNSGEAGYHSEMIFTIKGMKVKAVYRPFFYDTLDQMQISYANAAGAQVIKSKLIRRTALLERGGVQSAVHAYAVEIIEKLPPPEFTFNTENNHPLKNNLRAM